MCIYGLLVFDRGSLGPSTVTLIALLYDATCGGLVETVIVNVKLLPVNKWKLLFSLSFRWIMEKLFVIQWKLFALYICEKENSRKIIHHRILKYKFLCECVVYMVYICIWCAVWCGFVLCGCCWCVFGKCKLFHRILQIYIHIYIYAQCDTIYI